jgi:RHS repeat-associated protein
LLSGSKFNKVKSIDQDGKHSSQIINTLGQKVVIMENNDLHSTLFKYDSYGNVSSVSNPQSHTNTYSYNYLNLLFEENHVDKGLSKYAYDRSGLMIGSRDALDQEYRIYEYDIYKRLIVQKRTNNTYTVLFANDGLPWHSDPTFNTTNAPSPIKEKEYFYHDWNRANQSFVHTLIRVNLAQTPSGAFSLGRLVQTKAYNSTGTQIEFQFYQYDSDGFTKKEMHQFNKNGITTGAHGSPVRLDYLGFNRQGSPHKLNFDFGINGMDFQYAYEYDKRNRIQNVYANYSDMGAGGGLIARYAYNSAHDLIDKKELYGSGKPICPQSPGCCYRVKMDDIIYTYDTRLRLKKMSSLLYDHDLYYDALNSPWPGTSLSNNYNGNINAILSNYKLAVAGTVPSQFNGPRTNYNYKYDGLNRLIQTDANVENPVVSLNIDASLAGFAPSIGDEIFTYSKNGNITNLVRGQRFAFNCAQNNNITFNYNSTNNWLTSFTTSHGCIGGGTNFQMTYYLNGNNKVHNFRNIGNTNYQWGTLPNQIFKSNYSSIKYLYDVGENRTHKETTPIFSGINQNEYYFNAQNGKTLFVYDINTTAITWYLHGNERIAEFKHAPFTCPPPPPPNPPGGPGPEGPPNPRGLLEYNPDLNPWEVDTFYLDKDTTGVLKWSTPWKLGEQNKFMEDDQIDDIIAVAPGLQEWLDTLLVDHDTLPKARLRLPDTLVHILIGEQHLFISHSQLASIQGSYDTISMQIVNYPSEWISLGLPNIEFTSVPLNELLFIQPGDPFISPYQGLFTEAVMSQFPPHGKYYIYDHLGNTRVVYHIECTTGGGSQTQGFRYVVDQAIDYYAFGKILREYVGTPTVKYKSTQHERDQETDLDYRIARYYDNEVMRFLCVDPMNLSRITLSPYNYVQNNPITRTDPMGMLDGDYYNRNGEYLGNDGIDDNRVYLVNNGVTARDLGLGIGPYLGALFTGFRSENTIEVGGLMILSRIAEAEESTNGVMSLIGRSVSDNVYSLEPGGPETIESNQNRRIPDGVYNVDTYSSERYPDNFILSNESVSPERLILIHSGNVPSNTRGCVLPGCSSGEGTVGNSRDAMKAIRTFFNSNNTSLIDRRDDIKLIIRTNINR